jgi:MraZ protein
VGESGKKWEKVEKMFRGVTQLNLDNKFRLAIPARYRNVLAEHAHGRLVMTADPHKCLLLYPEPDWEPIQQKLMSLSSFNPRIRSLQRLLVGYAEDIELDSAGRILVPTALRDYAGLDKRAVLVGQGNKFELWDEEKWMEQRNRVFSEDEIPEELEGFSL